MTITQKFYASGINKNFETLKNKLKLKKRNNYQAYFCDNFWNKRKVEMRKFDCNSFRITGNTNFKKTLTSFLSKSVWGNPAMKVKVATEIRRHTAGAEAVVFRPFSERLLWMNTEEQKAEVIFWKIYLKTQMLLYSNEIRLFQRNVPV